MHAAMLTWGFIDRKIHVEGDDTWLERLRKPADGVSKVQKLAPLSKFKFR